MNDKFENRAPGIEKNGVIYPAPDADPMWLLNPQPLWSPDEIAKATGGEWISGNLDDLVITGVCYRKSEILPGDLYLPRNPKHWAKSSLKMPVAADVERAFTRGAVAIVLHKIPHDLPTDIPVLMVKNTRKALYGLANYSRDRFTGKVVGVTGSAGKTTVKEMLRYLLAQVKPTVSSRANFNHDVGVALSLAQTPPAMSYGVFEFGVDAPHLTRLKANMLRPDIAIVTEIYEAHLSHYKTLDKIVEQKSLLFDAVTENGTVILNQDSHFYNKFRENAENKGIANILTYGQSEGADIQLKSFELKEDGSEVVVSIEGNEIIYHLSLPGFHNIQNSLAVLGAIKTLGEDYRFAADVFKQFKNIKDRTKFYDIKIPGGGSFKIIDDVFNANTGSIKAGLKLLSLMAEKGDHRKVAVLGQMKKPGAQTEKLHSELSQPILEEGVDKVYTLGADMLYLREALPKELRGSHGDNYLDIINDLVSDIRPDDILLLKGPDPSKEKTKNIAAHLLAHQKNVFSCLFVGDCNFGESYQERYKREGQGNILELKGYDYPLDHMRTMLTSADLVIANLETPLTSLRKSPFENIKSWLHHSDTKSSPECYLRHNMNVLSLANNHCFDYGEEGFKETLNVLKQHKISYFGGGEDLAQARLPYIKNIEFKSTTFKMAVFASYKVLKKANEVFGMYAGKEKIGVNPLYTRSIKREIDKVREKEPDTFIVLFPHWGANYKWRTENQQELAHAMINAGADLIIGHGSHMVQEVERYHDKWIVYSIGNFMFNSRGRYKKYNAPPYSLVAKLDVCVEHDSTKLNLKLFPIFTNNRATHFQPRFVDGKEFISIYEMLKEHGSSIESGHISAERHGEEALFCFDIDLTT
jgi:UDP-N-acetylmuramoyl-tripeptide--D-alanyl-D-alanine ligase